MAPLISQVFVSEGYIESNFNIELVRMLHHSSVLVTQRYPNVGTKEIETVLELTSKNLV